MVTFDDGGDDDDDDVDDVDDVDDDEAKEEEEEETALRISSTQSTEEAMTVRKQRSCNGNASVLKISCRGGKYMQRRRKNSVNTIETTKG